MIEVVLCSIFKVIYDSLILKFITIPGKYVTNLIFDSFKKVYTNQKIVNNYQKKTIKSC